MPFSTPVEGWSGPEREPFISYMTAARRSAWSGKMSA